VLHQIGAGTLGPVFRAYDATRERLVAVKLFKLDLPPERGHQLVAEFERLIAADFQHPAIAAPLATGISGVSAFLAQDYVAADSLDLAVREYGPAPPGNALRVAAQLAGALDYAAAVQVTHGALHPRDVLLSSDDTRLTGLGVTRALQRIGVVAPVRRPYTAPERMAGGEWDRRADVFSLAALMHELLWGRRVSGLGIKAASQLTEIEGADLAALQQVFARALADDPGDRFATALEFAEALQAACPDIAIAPEAAPPDVRRPTAEEALRLPLGPPTLDEPAEPRRDDATQGPAEAGRLEASRPAPDVAPGSGAAPEVPQGFSPADSRPVEPTFTRDEAAHSFTPTDLDIAAPPAAAAEIVYQPVPELLHADPYDSPARAPAGLVTGHDGEPLSALEVSRTAIWPLLLALGVGMAVGFGGGFFVGSREQTPAPVAAAPAAAATPVPAGKEFTEAAVPAAPASDGRSQKSEADGPKVEPPKNPHAETGNLKSPAPPAAAGRLLVRSHPAGARVSVDGKDRGVTPAAIRDLARGAHHVRITHDGYAPEERRVVITTSRPAQSLTVPLARTAAPPRTQATATSPAARFVGALAVESRPAGAKVFLDGQLVGTTPMALPSVSAGSHAIRLEHDGYRRWSSSVRVVASEQNRVTASLER
jgi:hypothetical protein